jgi:methionyl-tRNA formyltransferase
MQHSIPYFLLHKNNDDEFNEWLRDLRPDAVLVYSMSKLLKPGSLSIPRLGFINFHPSLLPKYRGSNPWFWVFYFAEAENGVTVHKIDSGLDTGNILLQESFPIRFGASKLEVVSQFEEQSRRLLPRLFELLSIGKVDGTPQRFSQDEVLAPEPSLTLLTSIKWDEWDVERAFHFLCGMLGEYPQLIAFEQADSRQRLSVTSYTKGSTPPHHIVDEQLSLNCSNGRVFFEWEN